MLYIILFSLSFLIAYYLIPRILLISLKKRLVNGANNRTVHTQIASRLGGVSFFPSTIIPMILIAGVTSFLDPRIMDSFLTIRFLFGISALFLMYLLGVIDDVADIRYRTKFIFQILAGVMIVSSGVYIHDLHGIFGINQLPSWLAYPFSVFLILFITNAINLIDGIDGLASSLSVIALMIIAFMLCFTLEFTSTLLAVSTLGSLFAFLKYNLFGMRHKSSKIFMGDSGSLFLGGVLSILIFKICGDSVNTSDSGKKQILLAWSVLFVPCIDVLRVMLHRFKNRTPVFRPDKNHIHHKFLALGYTQHQTLMCILGIALSFIALNIFLSYLLSVEFILLIDIILWILGNIFLTKQILKSNLYTS